MPNHDRDVLEYPKAVLRTEAAAIAALADTLDHSFAEAVELIASTASAGHHLVVTGVGKSGDIGRKLSSTFASLGIPSHFVHPTDAAHGDMGRIRPDDLCLALSYSGETTELVALIASLAQDGVRSISITGSPKPNAQPSTLARLAHVALSIGQLAEADTDIPAPTVSTTTTLALGDALALAACRAMQFTAHDFAKRHPGGSLGGLLRPVGEILRFRVGHGMSPVSDTFTVGEAIAASESDTRRPGAMLLTNADGTLSGIFTDADLRRLIIAHPDALSRPIANVMTTAPTTLNETALVRDALNIVRESRRDEIPVVDADGKPVGVLDVQDLMTTKSVAPTMEPTS